MDVDRIAPTRRPDRSNAGTQRWRELLFLHWAVPADVLRPLVPAALDLDLHDGVAYVGLVPFQMRDVRPWWLPSLFAFTFLETNVRTYVVHRGRPGVYFFSLDASSRLAVWAAQTFWSLPYVHAAMSDDEADRARRYRSHRAGGAAPVDVTFRRGEHLGPSTPDTLEFFLLERYLLFVEKGGRIHEGQVAHTPYEAWTAEVDHLEQGLVDAAGVPLDGRPPELAHYSPGVDVEVFSIGPSPAPILPATAG